MAAYKKIEKWAYENGYKIRTWHFNTCIVLEKESGTLLMDGTLATQHIFITLEYNTNKLLSLVSYITHSSMTKEAQELENLFIPLNNVKRDEKLLKEYLKNER